MKKGISAWNENPFYNNEPGEAWTPDTLIKSQFFTEIPGKRHLRLPL